MATCAHCGAPLTEWKCRKCGKKGRDAETLQRALSEALGGRYEFRSILGAGGFAEVYKARDTTLERDVAIKRVKLDAFADSSQIEELRKRAVREAKVAASLNHPNIVTIHDIVDLPDMNLIVMEFIDGETLEVFLRRKKPLGLDETVQILAQAADAMDYAHSRTIVHRDIKPANIMIEPSGRVKVMDFGIAKLEGSQDITVSGSILGTPNYMSPEQARGKADLDAKTDVFALGCIVYECLAGEKAFKGNGSVEVLMQIVNSEPPMLDTVALDLHDGVNALIKRALAKAPAQRFESGMEMMQALRDVPRAVPRQPKGPAKKGKKPPKSGEPVAMPVVTRRDPDTASSFDLDLQGDLSERSVPELIRQIYTGRKTGILHVTREPTSKRIYFRKGSVVFANSDAEEDKLGEMLLREGMIDRALFDLARGVMRDTGQRLGRTLVELGKFDEKRLDALVADQVHRIIYSVFTWRKGYFGFELLSDPVEPDIALSLSTAETILEGVRRIESLDFVREALGKTSRVLVHTENPLLLYQKMTLTPSEGFVLSRVDGAASIEDIASISPLGEEETLRCVYALVSAGVVELADKVSPTSRMRRPRTEELFRPDPKRARPSRGKSEAAGKGASPADASPGKADAAKAIDEQVVLDEIATKHAALASVDFYELLEIERTADAAAIKKGYYAMVKRYHPDRHHSPRLKKVHGLLEEIFVKIQRGYETLSDAEARKDYDRHLPKASPRAARGAASTSPSAPEPTPTRPPPSSKLDGSGQAHATYVPPNPDVLAETQYRAAKQHYAEMSYYDAITCARDAIRYVPDKGHYHRLLAQALAKNPKWTKQAEQHFQTAIELDAFDVESRLGLAELYEEWGMTSRAKKVYEQVLESDPDHRFAKEKVGAKLNDSGAAFGRLRHLAKLLSRESKKD